MSAITIDQPTTNEIKEWWRWLLNIDQVNTPLNGGNNVTINNPQSLWECACTGGMNRNGGRDNNVRDLPINDFQKGILIAVLTRVSCKEELVTAANPNPTDDDARNNARAQVVSPDNLFCIINGTYNVAPLPTEENLIESGLFLANVPPNNILDGPPNLRVAQQNNLRFYSSGYWIKLYLTPGIYTVNFGGRIDGRGHRNDFDTNVMYLLHPVP